MSCFTEQDELKYYLESRWERKSQVERINSSEPTMREFPINKSDLINDYRELERRLNKDWHPIANLGAAISGDGLLTDHGVEHINAVMHHVYEIIGKNISSLNGYEIFLLLIAIHFHDLGNIYGRDEHEKIIDSVIDSLGDSFPLDTVEKEFVIAIAKSHGGYIDKDKDTIRYVNVDETCNGIQVRAKMLAALLRFADEISDDFYRASAYKNIKIPEKNKIFHAYSEVLEPVSIKGETIKFHFRLPYKYTQVKLGKGDGSEFLYDEILRRLTKCMRELEYCRKYANGYIPITTLNITIDILQEESTTKIRDKSSFRLKLIGYPDTNLTRFEDFLETTTSCPSSNLDIIKYRSGEDLKKAMAGGI